MAYRNSFSTPAPKNQYYTPAPKPVYQTPKPKFIPQISTNTGTRSGNTANFVPQISTPQGTSSYNPGSGWSAPVRPSAPSNPFTSTLQNLVSTLSRPTIKPYTDIMASISGNQLTAPTGVRATAAKAIGKTGKAISSVGNFLGAPQLAPGGFGAQLQNFAGNLLSLPLRAVSTPVRGETNTPDWSGNSYRPDSVKREQQAWIDQNRENLDAMKKSWATDGMPTPTAAPAGEVLGIDEIMKKDPKTWTAGEANEVIKFTQNAKSPYSKAGLTKSYAETNSAMNNLDPETRKFYENVKAIYDTESANQQPILDQMWREVEGGQRDYEDYVRKQDEVQRQAIVAAYDAARREAEAQIPLIEQDFTTASTKEKDLLDQFIQTLSGQRTAKSNTYDEELKRSVKNQRLEEGRLRNVFSNLGTAESSAFIDKMTELAQDAGGNQNDITRQKLADLGSLDTLETNEKKNFATRMEELLNSRNKAITGIRSGITSNEGKQAGDIAALTSTLLQNLATGKGKAVEAKTNLYNTQLGQSQKFQDYLTQYAINDQLAKNQSDYSTASVQGNQMIGTRVRPSGLPSDMWGLAAQLYNQGVKGDNLVNELRRRGGVGWNEWYGTLRNLLR